MHKFQKQGGAGSEPERNGREWSRVEREICSAASEHACGLQTAAGEGHRRSLLSCSPLGWGRLGRSVGDENSKICGNFWLRPKGRRPRPPKFRKEFVETLVGANPRLNFIGHLSSPPCSPDARGLTWPCKKSKKSEVKSKARQDSKTSFALRSRTPRRPTRNWR